MSNFIEILPYLQTEDDTIYQTDLNATLRTLLSDEGWVLPRLTSTNVTDLGASIPNGAIWYNSTTNELQCMKAGTVRNIDTTP